MQIIGYNWNGTPIYGQSDGTPFTTSQDMVVNSKKTGQSIDWNNVIDNIPGFITAVAGAARRPETPVINVMGDPNIPGGRNNTMLYIGAAIALIVMVVILKK